MKINNNLKNIHFGYIAKYPKLLLLLITFLAAYLLFYGRQYAPFHDFIMSLGYAGAFMAGIFFAYGFTAAPATAVFLMLAEHQNIYTASLIGGIGALAGDLLIFSFIRHSFADEFRKLSREKMIMQFNGRLPDKIKKYFLPVVAGFVIASPLPDEIGVMLLAASKAVSIRIFGLISYALNTAGIFVIYLIGSYVG